jgi:hypothetical protein
VNWRATIALAALLAIGLGGTAIRTPETRDTGGPSIGVARSSTSASAELRRGRDGAIGSRTAHRCGSGPFAPPPRRFEHDVIRAHHAAPFGAPSDDLARGPSACAVARGPPLG